MSSPSEAGPVLMRYTATVKVMPEYVQAYLDDGWTIVEALGESE